MCAIAGIIGHPDALPLAARMAAAQAHRGPDASVSVELAPGIAVAHRRLAILDLSPRGAQPMTSRDQRWTVVLNGELFNYRELRAELEPFPWKSEGDTEVLLEAIAAWGLQETLHRAIGMFAFAVWDHREQALMIARDRIGEKPLVYFWDGSVFAFASEMKALAELHGARLNPAAVDAYLALGYVPAPLGIFRDTHKLPAGHFLTWHEGRLEVARWWFPEHSRPNEMTAQPFGPSEARREAARSLIADAVRLRLRADVPIALALSGGVDSSVIAAELARQQASPDVFTVVFDGDTSELEHARAVARHLHLRLETVEARGCDVAGQVEGAQARYDEPFADSSSLGCLALARAFEGRYKVILLGDGGDEAFGGYRHYEYVAAKQALKTAAAAVGLRDGFRSSTVYVQSKALFRGQERSRMLARQNGEVHGALERLLATDPFLKAARDGALHQALWTDRHLALANALTYKTDIALSAYGLEGRAPLLDHRILEWTQNLNPADLVRGREKKILLREAYREQLPQGVMERAKRGFGAPISCWLAGPLQEMTRDLLPCPLLDRLPTAELSGQRLWTVLQFAAWARHWRARWS